MEIAFFTNPGPQIQSPTFYRIALKAGLYHKAVQTCYIHMYVDPVALIHIF